MTSLASVLWVVLTPAVPLHEATHALVGRLVGAEVEDMDLVTTDAYVRLSWPSGTTVLAVYLAHLAPLLVGLGLALLAIAFVGLPSPTSLFEQSLHKIGLATILVVNWAVYAYPSREDRRPFG